MHWNHRVLAHPDGEEDIYLQIHEVHYDDDGTPRGYGETPANIGSETINGLNQTLDWMKDSLTKPILWAGDRFPEEYKTPEG